MTNSEHNETKRFGPWATLSLAVLAVVVGYTVSAALRMRFPNLNPGQNFVMGIGFLLAMLLVIPAVAACFGRSTVPEYFGLRLPGWRAGITGLAAFAGYVVCMDMVLRLMQRREGMEAMQKIWLDCPDGSLWQVGFVVGVVLAAPVCEEVLFRGFILEGLAAPFAAETDGRWLGVHWGEWGAVIISSAMWASLHSQYEWIEITALFLMGVVLAVVRLRTKSLYLVIGLHAANNLVSFLVIVHAKPLVETAARLP